MALQCDLKAAYTTVQDSETIAVRSSRPDFPDLTFKTIRLSCESHPYRPGRNYAGFILFGLQESDGRVLQEWQMNGKRCKSAYLVIQDTGSEEVKRYIGKARGQVHGAVYWNVFGEGADVLKAIGEGFALVDKEYKWNSFTFNAKLDRIYHDGDNAMSEEGRKCVRQIWEDWRRNSAVGKTYSVKDLLKQGMDSKLRPGSETRPRECRPRHHMHCHASSRGERSKDRGRGPARGARAFAMEY